MNIREDTVILIAAALCFLSLSSVLIYDIVQMMIDLRHERRAHQMTRSKTEQGNSEGRGAYEKETDKKPRDDMQG